MFYVIQQPKSLLSFGQRQLSVESICCQTIKEAIYNCVWAIGKKQNHTGQVKSLELLLLGYFVMPKHTWVKQFSEVFGGGTFE